MHAKPSMAELSNGGSSTLLLRSQPTPSPWLVQAERVQRWEVCVADGLRFFNRDEVRQVTHVWPSVVVFEHVGQR